MDPKIQNSLITAIRRQQNNLATFASFSKKYTLLRAFLILFECPLFWEPEHLELFSQLISSVLALPNEAQVILKGWWKSIYTTNQYQPVVRLLQNFVTFRILINEPIFSIFPGKHVEDALKVLQILYSVNETRTKEINYTEFYNDAINERFKVRKNFNAWVYGEDFSYCNYPFLLNSLTKSKLMAVESETQMNNLVRGAIFESLQSGQFMPFFMLRVRREHVVEDAFNIISATPSHDLKKQLRVKFEEEAGVDAGGVKKEFFQIIVRELFDPKYGMFTYDEETHFYWFNRDSLETNSEFFLIGAILGLAIYNQVILDVHFPPVVYKKLLDKKPTLEDLKIANPDLGRGLQTLLDFDGDIKEVYDRNFQIEYESFGQIKTYDLKPNAENIILTEENRKEYVDLYVEFELVKSIEQQFNSFHRGFKEVCEGMVLSLLRPEELELLVCGDPIFDFSALQAVCKYEDGYTATSQVIKWLWEILSSFSIESQKKFLFFTCGSDRVPVGGLTEMKFVISRNGPDSDRLPTAHTCFNHLLLPEYTSKEKLREKLETAIKNSEGFGML
ncbi:e3 ubiquitin-protein ligase hectd2-related [Anaeramoeba ignava]|uniref:HECT-type E3 ubiquitin transferase n=1 Tax=Anaeramoeba ignava TaxID=1746090 RepID=A0A9Q0LNY9_ANAIG|nr:e3 ubiquitin-protein ligase hectd2-related [Anaeramoeba ignava]